MNLISHSETWLNLKDISGSSDFTLQSETKNSHIDGELLEIKENTTLEYTSDRVAEITENTITLTNILIDSFKINQRLLLITTYGSSEDTIGNYEFVEIKSISENVLTLKNSIQKKFETINFTFVVAPKRYNKIVINENVTVSSIAWSRSETMIQGLVLLSANEVIVNGKISADNIGFRGGNIGTPASPNGGIGESYVSSYWNRRQAEGAFGSGGSGRYASRGSSGDVGTSGAGAGHGSKGGNGTGGGGWFLHLPLVVLHLL